MSKLDDLLFVIGLFLTIVGVIVLGTSAVGASDLVQGIRVNLLGGGMMALVGASMIVASLMRKHEG